jgi:hypothetical protein
MGAAKFCGMARAHRERTLIRAVGLPLWRSKRLIRPATCSAFHGRTHGLTPFSKSLTIWLVNPGVDVLLFCLPHFLSKLLDMSSEKAAWLQATREFCLSAGIERAKMPFCSRTVDGFARRLVV